MSALATVPSPATIAARMGRTVLTTRRQEMLRTVRDMGIGLTDARNRGRRKKK